MLSVKEKVTLPLRSFLMIFLCNSPANAWFGLDASACSILPTETV